MTVAPKRSRREWDSQERMFTFLSKALPLGAMCRSVDEAAKRTKDANLRRHARGCHGGFGDIYVLWDGITLWLEAKAGSETSEKQDSFRDLITRNRGHYAVVTTMEDVEAACIAAGIPLRATLGEIRQRIEDQNARLPAKRKYTRRKPIQTGDRISVKQAHASGFWK